MRWVQRAGGIGWVCGSRCKFVRATSDPDASSEHRPQLRRPPVSGTTEASFATTCPEAKCRELALLVVVRRPELPTPIRELIT